MSVERVSANTALVKLRGAAGVKRARPHGTGEPPGTSDGTTEGLESAPASAWMDIYTNPGPDSGYAPSCAFTRSATSDGFVPTRTPLASRASFLACAVPDEPVMIAPAWPICFPGGAWKPAM